MQCERSGQALEKESRCQAAFLPNKNALKKGGLKISLKKIFF
jgi:hypothetical protein